MSKGTIENILDADDYDDMELDEKGVAEDTMAEPKKALPKRPAIIDRGILKLETPIISNDEQVTELEYDFTKLTGKDLVQVLDSRTSIELGTGEDGLNARKAKLLFAKAAAGKKGLDAYDIEDRLGLMDSLAAIQLGKSFHAATLVEVSRNIRSL